MRRFHEDKERLIRRLDLDPIQQDKLIRLFKQYPNLESKIDWNKRNLSWANFQDVLSQAGKSRNQAQKKGLEGLKRGQDYEIVKETADYVVYYPMNHLASKVLASKKVAPAFEGKWCISTNSSEDWDTYVGMGIDFFFFFAKENPEDDFPGEKYAIARYPEAMKRSLLPRLRMNHLRIILMRPFVRFLLKIMFQLLSQIIRSGHSELMVGLSMTWTSGPHILRTRLTGKTEPEEPLKMTPMPRSITGSIGMNINFILNILK